MYNIIHKYGSLILGKWQVTCCALHQTFAEFEKELSNEGTAKILFRTPKLPGSSKIMKTHFVFSSDDNDYFLLVIFSIVRAVNLTTNFSIILKTIVTVTQ